MTQHENPGSPDQLLPGMRMMTPTGSGPPESAALEAQVARKRAEIEAKLAARVRSRRRLVNLNIVAGTCSVALTSAPALGGKPFADWLTGAFGLESPAWQLLCALAAALSVIATLATQLSKSHGHDDYVTRAQGVRVQLELLEVELGAGSVSRDQAAERLLHCVQETASL